MTSFLVVDASVIVDLLLRASTAPTIETALRGRRLRAPAHFDIEVLSALGRLQRSGKLTPGEVERHLDLLAKLPLLRIPVAGLLAGAWRRRDTLRVSDAVYVQLAEQLGCRLLTTDLRLARATEVADAVPPAGMPGSSS